MKDFSFSINQSIHFGNDALNRIDEFIDMHSMANIFLLSDKGLEKLGLVKKVKSLLESKGATVTTFTDVKPNPETSAVYLATEKFLDASCDTIIAFGGGSPMDVAKAVAILAKYGGKVRNYEGVDKIPGEVIPIIAIPTTAGTGSEVTAFSVITDTDEGFKFSILSDYLKPKEVILDPSLITSLPKSIAAFTGVDAFIHALETYLSLQSNPFSASLALHSMSLIGQNIRKFVANRADNISASNMLIASTLAGIAFSNSRLGDIHAMSHPISARYHTAHGLTNAALLPTVLRYNMIACREKYLDIYNCIVNKKLENSDFHPNMLIDAVEELLLDIDMPIRLNQIEILKDGINDNMLALLADDTLKSGNVYTNPRSADKQDIITLYKTALSQ
jgi:alcohol dehydrogenase